MTTVGEAGAPLVRARGLTKRYGPLVAVAGIDFEIAAGEFCAVLGPSGCGKTTVLRMLAGFVRPDHGTIEIDGVDVTRVPPERRPTNMVFQSYGLFPHMTVGGNVAFGPTVARWPPAEVARRVGEALALVRLEGFADRPVEGLSGGQQQRVALARALVMRPRVLLLDEPLAALDLKLRQAMQEELRRIHRAIGGTFVFVTHDQGEAFQLADRVIVMNRGRIEQAGPPELVYREPATAFVAGFVGETNRLVGERRDGVLRLAAGCELCDPGPDGPVELLVRPEGCRFSDADDAHGVAGYIVDIVFLGPTIRYVVQLRSGETVRLYDSAGTAAGRHRIGSSARVTWDTGLQRVSAAS